MPADLLRAVALAESGRRLGDALRPWPWTVNMEGIGRWFSGPGALLDWVRARRAEGARSFDLGCFQVNHRWHGHAFDSLADMLDPEENARYAARFLKALHAETGDWRAAVGFYHSRTPARAAHYRARVANLRAALPETVAAPARPPAGWPLSSLRPDRPAAPAGGADRAADAAAASLARAWIAGRSPGPGPAPGAGAAGAGGLLRRAAPLIDARDGRDGR